MVKKEKGQKEKIKLNPKERVVNYLIENKNPQSIMTLSGATLLDYKNTYNIVNELQPDLISKEKIGNTNLIKLNLIPNQQIYSVENKRTLEFLEANKNLKLIKEDIESLNYPFFIVLIFGSVVKNLSTKKSDVDLCIICDNKEESKKLMAKLGLLSMKLEIQNFTSDEFKSMLRIKENNVGKEIIKNNIILYGIENYYNLISKWMKKE